MLETRRLMPLERYGVKWPDPEAGVDPSASIELRMAFHEPFFKAKGFLGRYEHLRNAIDLIWNEPRRRFAAERKQEYDPRKHDAFIWNDWTERMMRAFCEYKWRTFTSGNAGWKTTSLAVYYLCAWFASPHDTAVVLTSQTIPGLRRRIWKEVVKYWRLAGSPIGNIVQSEIAIQFRKGEMEAGIFGVGVGQDGDVDKAVNKIIGFHMPNIYAGVDEMQATNEAIVKGAVSLEAGTQRFEFTGLGNAESELDPHGQMSEPIEGWASVDKDTDEWLTKRGICLHFNCYDCPRVREGDEFYPGMLRQVDIDSTIRDYGEDSPEFWSKRIGFWAPQDVSKSVFSSALITKFVAREQPIWIGEFTEGLALDPAYEGGDRCMLRVLRCGKIDSGITVIAPVNPPMVIKVKVSVADDPIHYQIMRRVKKEAEDREIPPNRIALDSTGEGGGLHSIMVKEIGYGILAIEFGGAATRDPVSKTNPKPANQEYYNRATQLWFFLRTVLMNGQLRGLDLDTATELCKRPRKMNGGRVQIIPKKEMPGKSPDLADALVVGAQLFRNLGMLDSELSDSENSGRSMQENWREFARKYDVVNADYADV